MNSVCEVCGAIGFEHLLLCCSDCKGGHTHQYCLDKVLFDAILEDWFCDECKQRHSEGSHSRSLENVSSETPSIHGRMDSTLQQPITKRVDSATAVGTWGQQKSRSTEVEISDTVQNLTKDSPKKHGRLILTSDDEEEEEEKAEDVQQESINEQPLKCNEPMMKLWINTEYYVEEAVQTGDINVQSPINGRPMKRRRRYIAENEDEEDIEGAECALNIVSMWSSNDSAKMASRTPVATDHYSLQSRSFDSECANRQYHICSQPLDDPVWSGIFNIDNEVFLKLDAHLSNKACQRVHELSGLLPPVVEVRMLSRLQAWPERWISSGPTDESIGLFFLPHSSMQNEDLSRLINRIIKSDDALQGKYYLWGVFRKRKDNLDNSVHVEEQDHSTHVTGEGQHQELNLLDQQDEAETGALAVSHVQSKNFQNMLPIFENDIAAMTEKAAQNDAQCQVEEIPGLRSQLKALGNVGTALRGEKAELEAELKSAGSERPITTATNFAAPASPASPQSPGTGITQTKVMTHNQPAAEHDPSMRSDGEGQRTSQEQGRLMREGPDRVCQCTDGHRDTRTLVGSSGRNKELAFEQVSRHFTVPIEQAAREMNVGKTVLKKQCRKLGITRWPHRKVKSLQKLIDTLQGLGKENGHLTRSGLVGSMQQTMKLLGDDEAEDLRQLCFNENNAQEDGHVIRRVVKLLQLTKKKMIEERPNMILDHRTKQLRQACFKESFRRKRS